MTADQPRDEPTPEPACGFRHDEWDGPYVMRRRCTSPAGHSSGNGACDHGPWEVLPKVKAAPAPVAPTELGTPAATPNETRGSVGTGHACGNCEGIDPGSCLMNPDRREPDNETATALARHIASHPVGVVQAAYRLLGMELAFEVREDTPAPDGDGQAAAVCHCGLGTRQQCATEPWGCAHDRGHVPKAPQSGDGTNCACPCEGCAHWCAGHSNPARCLGATLADISGAGPAQVSRMLTAVEAHRDDEMRELRERLRKAERAVNLLADSHRRAEQVEDLLRIAHDTSNKSEAERALAVQRAEQAEVELAQLRPDLEQTRETSRGLSLDCHQAQETNRRLNRRAQQAEAALARVRALADRLDDFAEVTIVVPDRKLYTALVTDLRTALANPPAGGQETGADTTEVPDA